MPKDVLLLGAHVSAAQQDVFPLETPERQDLLPARVAEDAVRLPG
jgi:hypothetical protein